KVMIPINIDLLTRGSFGIFGKSGTGKTHLGNIIASLIIISNKKNKLDKPIKLLIFDMHSEYGLKVKDQHGNDYADGVGLLFKNDFKIYTPDILLSKEFRLEEFNIDPRELDVEDLEILKENLDLTQNFLDYLHQYKRMINDVFERVQQLDDSLKKHAWILYLLGYLDERKDLEKELKIIENRIEEKIKDIGTGALASFRAGKGKLSSMRRYEFIAIDKKDTISEIVNELFYGERSVIISFGRYGDDPRAYTLIAHLLSKKIWQKAINEIMSNRQLKYKIVIFLEEAHKFLSGKLYYKTAFGEIARELRKRGIILCIIDQRPSQISEDVMGMLWNSFIFSLTTEVDIEASTKGLKYSHLFLPVVESLKRREALVFGEAIKMPAIITIRDYKEFAKEIEENYIKALPKMDIPGY
ncbi:MAG TPA: ATP-binding protein, partial [Geobacterales bacterium]|nr:ATP-binding protein [Geobacterales bacterium]